MQRLQGMTGLNNPVEIQLQYLPDDVLLARACITPASPTEENRNLASTCALAGLQHIARASAPSSMQRFSGILVPGSQGTGCGQEVVIGYM